MLSLDCGLDPVETGSGGIVPCGLQGKDARCEEKGPMVLEQRRGNGRNAAGTARVSAFLRAVAGCAGTVMGPDNPELSISFPRERLGWGEDDGCGRAVWQERT